MLFAVIDIGSNAARLLFAYAHGELGNITVEKATLIRIPLRLGKDVFSQGKISTEKEKEFIKTMKAFKLLQEVYVPHAQWACATAAMREATNGKKIARRIFIKTGIKLEIISGAKEAYIIRNINRIVFNNPQRLTVFIDVGGGSTEISIERNEELIKLKSFKVGTIRMLNDNFDPTIWKKIFTWFSQFKSEFDQVNVVGTGGNINKINKVFGDAQSIFLSIDRIQYAYDSLSALRLEERMEKYGFREDRADVIVPAAEIYLRILKMVKAKHIAVPKVGLADGMAHQLYEDYLKAKQAKGTE